MTKHQAAKPRLLPALSTSSSRRNLETSCDRTRTAPEVLVALPPEGDNARANRRSARTVAQAKAAVTQREC